MKFEDLSPGALRECVAHYRIQKQHDGAGGFTREPLLQNGSIRVAWEDRTPTATVDGNSLAANVDAEIGLRAGVGLLQDDWIVHTGYVYRVIRPRKRQRIRYEIVALEFIDVWDAARQGVT